MTLGASHTPNKPANQPINSPPAENNETNADRAKKQESKQASKKEPTNRQTNNKQTNKQTNEQTITTKEAIKQQGRHLQAWEPKPTNQKSRNQETKQPTNQRPLAHCRRGGHVGMFKGSKTHQHTRREVAQRRRLLVSHWRMTLVSHPHAFHSAVRIHACPGMPGATHLFFMPLCTVRRKLHCSCRKQAVLSLPRHLAARLRVCCRSRTS